jgi:hypothetical protein
MKTSDFLLILLLLITFSYCKQVNTAQQKSSRIILVKDQAAFNAAASNRSAVSSAPFNLNQIIFKGDSVEVSVTYSGGCEQHSFEFIWNGVITGTNPPAIDLIIQHNSNGDSCKAHITETLTFPLTALTGNVIVPDASLSVMNGGNASDSIVYHGNETAFNFTESDTCNTLVTARNAPCGWGLYGNLWFALDDSISAGIPNYFFHKYLQPVSISSNITGFTPVPGKRYKVGGRKDNGNYFPGPMCMIYAGPSIPIKIMCIKAMN